MRTIPMFAAALVVAATCLSTSSMPTPGAPPGLVGAAGERGAPGRPPAPALKPGDPCPLKTPDDWQRFLDGVAAQERLVDTCELQDCDEEYHAYIRDNVAGVMTACAKEMIDQPQIRKCTDHLRRYIPTWLVQHDVVGYGFTVDNKRYNEIEDGPDSPKGMMTVPRPLIDALPSKKKLVEAARANGYKYLTQDSMIDQGTRTFVFIPDPNGYYDKWMLFNLKDDLVEGDSPVSYIAVQKKDVHGKDLDQVRVYFRDYYMERSPVGYDLVIHEDSSGKCYACHPNGVRRLIPRETTTIREQPAMPVKGDPEYAANNKPSIPFTMKRLKEFNKTLKGYGTNDWAGMIRPEDHGPIVGDDQGCTECHDDDTRSALRMSTSLKQLWEKSYYQLAMPPKDGTQALLQKELLSKDNPHLAKPTPEEAEKLDEIITKHKDIAEELEESRWPTLKAWLTETPCNPPGK